MKSRNKAFTLIELLVVIAIIGILAGVVLASLNSARNKGRVASIKSNLRNAVSQSNIYFNENGTYAGFCDDPTIVSILSALGGAGNAACFVSQVSLVNTEFGIAATFDGTHFIADPIGVLELDSTNMGSPQSWDVAMLNCSAVGKRLSGGSALKALYDINNTTPTGFNTTNYWSNLSIPGSAAYAVDMRSGYGVIWGTQKNNSWSFRCGS